MQNRLALGFILATVLIDHIGIGIIFPIMPDLMREVTHTDISAAALWGGLLATVFAVMQFLCGPVVGNLSDRYGRRPVMLVALAVMAVDYVIMAVAQSIWLLVIGRIVAGATAATYATANAYVADISTPDRRAKNFGLILAAAGIGFIAGPLIGGISTVWGTRAPFWIAAGIAAANAVFGYFVLPESLVAEKRRTFTLARANPFAAFRAIGHLPGLNRYLLIMFVFTTCHQSYPAVWTFFGAERFGWDARWIGVSLAVFGLSMALAQVMAIGPATRAWGEKRTAVYGLSLDILSFGFYGFVKSGLLALIFLPVTGLASVAGPAMNGLMANATPDDQQGELQGVVAAVSAVAMGLTPMVFTFVFWAFTHDGAPIYLPGAPFLLSGVLMVFCVFLLAAPHPASEGGATPETEEGTR
jgi:DHA1 family tetracycline resistance protein-like MFS transporter